MSEKTLQNRRPTSGFKGWLRATFFSGLVVLIPLALTFYILDLVLRTTDRLVTFLPEALVPGRDTLPPGTGLVFAIVVTLVMGVLVRNFVGRWLLDAFHAFVDRIPFVASIYNLFKEIAEALLGSDKKKGFRRVVLVEWPRRGTWTVAFVAASTEGELAGRLPKEEGERYLNLFIPTTPNPTSGFFFMVPEKDVVPLSLSVDMAFKVIVSCGTLSPAQIQAKERAEEAKKGKS